MNAGIRSTPREQLVDERVLFALDEPITMFPVERAANDGKARYHGWKILDDVGYIECPFDPRSTSARKVWMYQHTDDPWAELTHRITDDPMVPGAQRYWRVEVTR